MKRDYSQLKEDVSNRIFDYLVMMGFPKPEQKFKCPNPSHSDSTPSCHLIPNSKMVHCFGCLMSGDIFTLCSFLEGKPTSGKAFITDNLFYLANKLGIKIPVQAELTEEELREQDIYRAYKVATDILLAAKPSKMLIDKFKIGGWTRQVRNDLIGCVESFQDYKTKLLSYGYSFDFLQSIDLLNSNIFDKDRIIFIVRDEYGNPVGYASRDLNYETKKATGEKAVKFINTSEKCPIYLKRKRLFNFSAICKEYKEIYILEGYGDTVTCIANRIKNVCSLGSIAFTEDHVGLLLSSKVNHIIFCLDADPAGIKGTERFVQIIEESTKGISGLKVSIATLPIGSDDPDTYLRSFTNSDLALEGFQNLPKQSLLQWKLIQKSVEDGDPWKTAEDMIPLLLSEVNHIHRYKQAMQICESLVIDFKSFWKEVNRQSELTYNDSKEALVSISKATIRELERNPDKVVAILTSASQKVSSLDRKSYDFDLSRISTALDYVKKTTMERKNDIDLKTGWELFDQRIHGIPFEGAFITVPGKPNHSKSAWMQNLCWRLPMNNSNVRVLYHTIDDAMSLAVPRILSSRVNIPINQFSRPYMFKEQEGFETLFKESWDWLEDIVGQEKLLVMDSSVLPGTAEAVETWIKEIRYRYPNDHIVFMGDNFHKYKGNGTSEESSVKELSNTIKNLTTAYHCTILMTMELPKRILEPGMRPRVHDIKASGSASYDSTGNFGIYNELKDLGIDSRMYWEGQARQLGDGMEIPKHPIVELINDKSKLSSFDGTIYFRFNEETGHFTECSLEEQQSLPTKETRKYDRTKPNPINSMRTVAATI